MRFNAMGRVGGLVATALLGFAVPASAQPGDFVLPPDYEQVRAGLPATSRGTQGGAYCGPSSAADLAQWLDDNGFPEIVFPDDTPGDITTEIFQLGLYMSTHPDNGTNPQNFVEGLQSYLDDSALGGRLEVSYVGRNMGEAAEHALGHSFGAIALQLNLGHLAIARVGWYQPDGTRCGGHYVAMTGYDFADGTFVARFRDSADARTRIRLRTIQDGLYDLEDPAEAGCPAPCIRNQWASSWQWSRSPRCDTLVTRTGIQDGVLSIGGVRMFSRPASGSFIAGYNLGTQQGSSHSSSSNTITSIAPQPHLFQIYHCGPSVNFVYKTDLVTDAVEPVPLAASLNLPQRLVFGSGLRLYVLQGSQGSFSVLAFDSDGNNIGQIAHPSLTDLTYWEKNDEIVLWSGPQGQIALCSPDLTVVTPITLPTGPPFVDPGFMVVDPRGDVLYYNHNGSSSIFRFDLASQVALVPLTISGLTDPGEMEVDNRGHLYVAPAVTGPVVELDAGGSPVTGSPANSFMATDLLAMTRAVRRPLIDDYAGGRTDADRPVDLGDFDNDLDVDPDDFQDFYQCYRGAGSPYPEGLGCVHGDWDSDFDVDCVDYQEFAAAWTSTERLPVIWECRSPTDASGAPRIVSLQLDARPNPFNPSTEISFDMPGAGRAELVLFDLRGRRVRVLVDGVRPAGRHRVTWDGRDEAGRSLPSGIYTARLASGDQVRARKLVLIK